MEHITLAAHYLAAVPNPFDNIIPDFSIFGANFNQLWQKLLAGIWALGILVAAVSLALGISRMAATSGAGANPIKHQEARNGTMWAAIALGALAAIGVIVGAILAVASS